MAPYLYVCYRPQRSWGKVMFSQASVILFTGGCLPQCMLGYAPQEQTPPGADTPCSRHPLEADTPRADTPLPSPLGADTTLSRHPPRRPGGRHPPGADTPLGADTPPQEQTPWSRHPNRPPQSMLGYMVNAWAVHILLECNLVIYVICRKSTTRKPVGFMQSCC